MSNCQLSQLNEDLTVLEVHQTKAHQKTVVVSDNDPMMRLGITTVLKSNDYVVVGEADNLQDVIVLVIRERPSLLVLDLKILGATPGFKHIKLLRDIADDVAVVVTNTSYHDAIVRYLYTLGVGGYWQKGEGNIDNFIGQVNGATVPMEKPSLLDNRTSYERTPYEILTEREIDVFSLVTSGKSYKEIGDLKGLAPTTVSNVVSKIKQKLNVDMKDFGWLAREYGLCVNTHIARYSDRL